MNYFAKIRIIPRFFIYLQPNICCPLRKMKLKKRKIKYSAIFFLCWFAVLVFLVDGVLKFQTLVDYFGSYALVEIALLLLVFLPTLAVYIFTKE